MRIITVKCLDDNFSYILINEESNNACVIDPGESKPIIDIILKEKLNYQILKKIKKEQYNNLRFFQRQHLCFQNL